METNKVVVLLLALFAVIITTVGSVSAAELANDTVIWVNGVAVNFNGYFTEQPAIFVGDSVPVKVSFVALKNAQDVRVEAQIDGYNDGIDTRTDRFDTIQGVRYTKTVSLDIPFDLKDTLSDSFDVTVKIFSDHDKSVREFTVKVQRQSYQLEFLSVDVSGTAMAGKTLPVELVLKNRGMRNLEDIFVTARIPALGVEKRMYFKDVFALDNSSCAESDCNDDSLYGKFDLEIPASAASGTYTLEISAANSDVETSAVKQIMVKNTIPSESVIPATSVKSFAVGDEAVYEILLVNPTDNVKVYRATADSTEELAVSVDPSLMALSSGSSQKLMVKVQASEPGKYHFGVNVFSETGELVNHVDLTANVRAMDSTAGGFSAGKMDNTVVALTIVLAVIFVVLLVVLITLLSKKPQKAEEFSESYY